MTFRFACPANALPSGSVVGCEVDGVKLALYNVDGTIHASQDACSHGRTSLSEGELDGFEIECPLHGGAFDVRTGAPVALPCIAPIRVYRTKVDGGDVLVLLDGLDEAADVRR